MLSRQKRRGRRFVERIGRVDPIPAQDGRLILARLRRQRHRQVHKLAIDKSRMPASHLRVEVVVAADAAARLQGRRHVVALGVLQDVLVNCVTVTVENLDVRVSLPELLHLVFQRLIVPIADVVQRLDATEGVVLQTLALEEGEKRGDAAQRGEVHHQDLRGDGQVQGRAGRRDVQVRSHHAL